MRNVQNGRRRGRNGPRPPQGGGGGRAPDMGNRVETRQRGNAHQLLEKYKTLARDAAAQGDRVTAEYYMQYADHYYRVLNEYRARQEEQRARYQPDEAQYQDDGDDGDGDISEGVDAEMRGPEPIALQGVRPTQAEVVTAPAVDTGRDADEGGHAAGGHDSSGDAEDEQPRRRPRGRPRKVRADDGGAAAKAPQSE